MESPPANLAMVFAGGLGLAAYHAGAYQAFSRKSLPLHWVAGSSAGAVTAALIAGNRAEDRIGRMRAFWNFPPIESYKPSPWRHLNGWLGAVRSRIVGSPGHFHPRLPSMNPFGFRSLYDLSPMRERLPKLIDFGLLNSGETRICIAATDIESGDPIIFDSREQRIELEHLMASCGFLPEFAPIEIDGVLSATADYHQRAVRPILQSETDGGLLLYVIDLYARDGDRPDSFEAALERKNDPAVRKSDVHSIEILS